MPHDYVHRSEPILCKPENRPLRGPFQCESLCRHGVDCQATPLLVSQVNPPPSAGLAQTHPPGGCFLSMRTLVQFDGQNLYRLTMRAYGPGPPYTWPSYNIVWLAQALVSRVPGRTLAEMRFYTGVPSQSQDAFCHKFCNNKLRALQREGVYIYRGRLSSNGQNVQGKGVDVGMAIDLV